MSLSNEQNFKKYSPSIPTTEFEWDVPYFDNTDVSVSVEASDGVITNLVLNASTNGFTVQATNGNKSLGATITTTESYTSGDNITISRQVPYTQDYDLKAGASINPTALNKALDRTVAQSQQLNEQIGRQLEHPITDAEGLNYTAPAVVDRASKACGWDASGNVTALNLVDSGTVGVDDRKGINLTNNIISSKVDGVTIGFDGNGKHEVKDGGIDDAKISDVATSKLTGKVLKTQIENVADYKLLGNVSGSATSPQEVDIIDDDTMATATAQNIPTAESVKAYVDNGFSPNPYAGSEDCNLPNGFRIKMGVSAVGANSTLDVTFGTAFPSAMFIAYVTIQQSGISALAGFVSGYNYSTTGFRLENGADVSLPLAWMAIGY